MFKIFQRNYDASEYRHDINRLYQKACQDASAYRGVCQYLINHIQKTTPGVDSMLDLISYYEILKFAIRNTPNMSTLSTILNILSIVLC